MVLGVVGSVSDFNIRMTTLMPHTNRVGPHFLLLYSPLDVRPEDSAKSGGFLDLLYLSGFAAARLQCLNL